MKECVGLFLFYILPPLFFWRSVLSLFPYYNILVISTCLFAVCVCWHLCVWIHREFLFYKTQKRLMFLRKCFLTCQDIVWLCCGVGCPALTLRLFLPRLAASPNTSVFEQNWSRVRWQAVSCTFFKNLIKQWEKVLFLNIACKGSL